MEGLTAVLSGGKTIHTESMQFSDCSKCISYDCNIVVEGEELKNFREVAYLMWSRVRMGRWEVEWKGEQRSRWVQ